MEVAQARLRMDQHGSDIPVQQITPAEVLVLRAAFEKPANGIPIKEVHVFGTVSRDNRTEVERLRQKYQNLKYRPQGKDEDVKVVDHLFPGENPALPQKFSEIKDLGQTRGKETRPTTYAPVPTEVFVAPSDDDGVKALDEEAAPVKSLPTGPTKKN